MATVADEQQVALPDDLIVFFILSDLALQDLIAAGQVCQQWRRCARHPSLWRYLNAGLSAQAHEVVVTPCELAHWLSFASPCQIDLESCYSVNDSALQVIASSAAASSLVRLNVASCRMISDHGLVHISRLQAMRVLSLRNCSKLTDSALAHMIEALPQLRFLDLGFTQAAGACIAAIGRLRHLEHLFLRRSLPATDDHGSRALSFASWGVPAVSRLRYLSLRACRSVAYSDCAPRLVALMKDQGFASLQRLDLRASGLPVGLLDVAARHCEALVYVDADDMWASAGDVGFAVSGYSSGWQYFRGSGSSANVLLEDESSIETREKSVNTFRAAFAPSPAAAAREWEAEWRHVFEPLRALSE